MKRGRFSEEQIVMRAKLPRNSAYTGIRCAVQSEVWKLTSALLEQREVADRRDRGAFIAADDGRHSSILPESEEMLCPASSSRTSSLQCRSGVRSLVRKGLQLIFIS